MQYIRPQGGAGRRSVLLLRIETTRNKADTGPLKTEEPEALLFSIQRQKYIHSTNFKTKGTNSFDHATQTKKSIILLQTD